MNLLILIGVGAVVIAYLLLRRRAPDGWTGITDGNVDALKNAGRIGFTFGGGTGYGHGVYGEGLFTLLEFAVE